MCRKHLFTSVSHAVLYSLDHKSRLHSSWIRMIMLYYYIKTLFHVTIVPPHFVTTTWFPPFASFSWDVLDRHKWARCVASIIKTHKPRDKLGSFHWTGWWTGFNKTSTFFRNVSGSCNGAEDWTLYTEYNFKRLRVITTAILCTYI